MKKFILFLALFIVFRNAQTQNNGKLTPEMLFGERLQITGDFDGDKKIDTLKEKFTDKKTGRETAKFIDSLEVIEDYQLLDRGTSSFLQTALGKGNAADTFFLETELGLLWLENIGDIDRNGRDEIGFVNYRAYPSSITYYFIATLKEKKWEILYNFVINRNFLPENDSIKFIATSPGKWIEVPASSGLYDLFDEETLIKNSTVKSDSAHIHWAETDHKPKNPAFSKVLVKINLNDFDSETQQIIKKGLQKGDLHFADVLDVGVTLRWCFKK